MKKLLSNRYGLAVFYIVVSVLTSLIMGGIMFGGFFSLINDETFVKEFWKATISYFKWIGAVFAVAGVLLIITKIKKDYVVNFSCGLYYGTGVLLLLIDEFCNFSRQTNILISVLLSSLIAFAVWLFIDRAEKIAEKRDEEISRKYTQKVEMDNAYKRTVRCLSCSKMIGCMVLVQKSKRVFPFEGNTLSTNELYFRGKTVRCYERFYIHGDLEIHIYVDDKEWELVDVRLSLVQDVPPRAFTEEDNQTAYDIVSSIVVGE